MKEARCSATIKKKDGKEITCGRFVAEISDNYVVVKCANCGALYVVSANDKGKTCITGFEKHSLFQNKRK